MIRLPITYEAVVGLKLNEFRVRLRRSYFEFLSGSYSSSVDSVPRELIDAVNDTPQEAGLMNFAINSARALNEIRARRG